MAKNCMIRAGLVSAGCLIRRIRRFVGSIFSLLCIVRSLIGIIGSIRRLLCRVSRFVRLRTGIFRSLLTGSQFGLEIVHLYPKVRSFMFTTPKQDAKSKNNNYTHIKNLLLFG
jgi:hypothetical protein